MSPLNFKLTFNLKYMPSQQDLVIDRHSGKDEAVCFCLQKRLTVNTVVGKTNKVTDRQKHKMCFQTDRQVESHTKTESDRHADTVTSKQIEKKTARQPDMQANSDDKAVKQQTD